MNANSDLPDVRQAKLECEDKDLRLAEILEEYLAELEQGVAPDRQTLLARHADSADRLASCLDSLEVAQRISTQLRDDVIRGTSQAPANTPMQLGDFRVLREIGRGGMGVVYEAEQISLPRRVALKVLPFAAIFDKRQLQRFQNEARAAATLDHPGIVSVHLVGCERGVHYYAMQLIEGQTLAQVISELRQRTRVDQSSRQERSDALSQLASNLVSDRLASPISCPADGDPTEAHPGSLHPEASHAAETVRVPHAAISTQRSIESVDFCRGVARLGIQAAEALDHAHLHGVLHRDIKPGNLMLDAEGKLRITDFGLARIQADPSMTVSGDILGTLRYMSPEQADGRFADQRSDVYSLGITLYELISLQPPFQGEKREELLKQIAWQDPHSLRQLNPAIPRELEIIIGKALAKEAGQRYATAQELADDLRCFLENRPIHARPPTLTDRAIKWLRRHPGLAVATLVASLLVMLTASVSTAVVWQAKRDAENARARAEQEKQEAENARARAEQEEAVAKQKGEETKAVVDFLVKDVLGSARADTGEAQKITMLEVLENTERKLERAFVDHPLLEARIRLTLGNVYGEMRMHDAELHQATEAHQLYKQHAGLEDHNTLAAETNMATALYRKGKFAEAIDIYENTMPVMRRVLPPGDRDTLACMSNLGKVLHDIGSFKAARKQREETLEWCRRHRTAEHRDTTKAMADLAMSLGESGDVTAARDLLQETLQIQQRVLGREHPLTLETLHRSAIVQAKKREFATARQLQEQVLEIRERVLGPEHPDTLMAMQNLAGTLFWMGESAAARQLNEPLVEARRRILGPEHPDTLDAMWNLGIVLYTMGDYATAREIFEQLVEIRQRSLGPDHPKTLELMNTLGATLENLGEIAAARELHEQVLKIRRRVLGDEHRDTLQTMINLSNTLAEADKAEARELREQILEIRRRVLGPEHPETLLAMHNLANSLEEPAAKRELREQVAETRQRLLGPEHPRTLFSMHNLAESLAETGEPAAARELREQVFEKLQRVLGPEHPDTLPAMHSVVESLAETGEPAAARKLLEREVEIRRRVQGPEHPDTVKAISALEEDNED